MKTKLNRRLLCAIGAAVVALSLLIGGVFAWADNSQHKTNAVTGGNKMEPNDVVLVEDFEEPDEWPLDDELKKEIWVKNTGDGQIYIRLQLKEYMDIAKVTYAYTDELLLVDETGKFVASTGVTQAQLDSFKLALTNMGLIYQDSQIKKYTAYGETAERYYLATDGTTNLNGKYGKRMILDYSQAAAQSLVEGVARGTYEATDDHKNHPTSECLYTPHIWNGPALENCGQGDDSALYDGTGLGFHDYVEWTLGPVASLVKLSEWDGVPVAAWILDDSSDEGWAYWGEALRPGERTDLLLQSINLIKAPDGPFYYAIHVDMQAADLYQLTSNFDGMPQEIEDAYRGKTGFAISADRQTFTTDGSADGYIQFKASFNGDPVPANVVTWAVRGLDGLALGPYTRFAATDGTATPGRLAIGGGNAKGRLEVTATYTLLGGSPMTVKYIVTIK